MASQEAKTVITEKPAETTSLTQTPNSVPVQPPADAFALQMGLLAVMVILFYVLMIRPQQKRFKEHNAMLGGLKSGDKIVTQGGLVGVIDKSVSDHEVMVDYGSVKISTLRSSILGRYEDALPKGRPANDDKKSKKA